MLLITQKFFVTHLHTVSQERDKTGHILHGVTRKHVKFYENTEVLISP